MNLIEKRRATLPRKYHERLAREELQRDPLAGREHVIGGERDDERLAAHAPRDQRGVVERPSHEPYVEVSRLERFELLSRRELTERYLDRRIARPKSAQQLGETAVGERGQIADGDAPALADARALGFARRQLDRFEYAAGMPQEGDPGGRQLDATT